MEIHFYELMVPGLNRKGWECFSWIDTTKAIDSGLSRIETTQMGLLNTSLFERGYRVFVHPYYGKPYEIKLGENNCTDRKIKMEHNLFNLWKTGEFF